MRILIYKRTHVGDPDTGGCFGTFDCMGKVRDWEYDAVIGVGGIGDEPVSHDIDGRVNWVGIGPHKNDVGKRGPEVTFDHYVYYGSNGRYLREIAPHLSARMYDKNVRAVLDSLTDMEKTEAEAIVKLAADAPPSPCRSGSQSIGMAKCGTRKRFSVEIDTNIGGRRMPNGDDKNWVRVCAAIDGFRAEFGYWPKRVRIAQISYVDLVSHVLSPSGFALVSTFVELVPEEDAEMIAEDNAGRHYEYGRQGFPERKPDPSTWDWFGLAVLRQQLDS